MAKASRDTLYAPLRLPRVYNLLQSLTGGSRDRADFVKRHVLFRSDEKVVDAGCGTGSALEFLPPVKYVGFDPNSGYIHAAQSRYGSRGQFLCGDADSSEVWELVQSADTFLSFGVLHHLTDSQIRKILSLAQRCLRQSGRFIIASAEARLVENEATALVQTPLCQTQYFPYLRVCKVVKHAK